MVWLSDYLLCLLDRPKRIDIDRPKRSSELNHHQISSSTSTSSDGNGDGGGSSSSSSSSIKEEEEEVPWLIEIKNYVLFWKK